MKRPIFIVTESFQAKTEAERKTSVQQKMEQYLQSRTKILPVCDGCFENDVAVLPLRQNTVQEVVP